MFNLGWGEEKWFAEIRGKCNPVEYKIALRDSPPPETYRGAAYEAACYALAGDIEQTRRIIGELPAEDQPKAAQIVFDTVHYVSDAGDEISPGAVMRLTVEYMPYHY